MARRQMIRRSGLLLSFAVSVALPSVWTPGMAAGELPAATATAPAAATSAPEPVAKPTAATPAATAPAAAAPAAATPAAATPAAATPAAATTAAATTAAAAPAAATPAAATPAAATPAAATPAAETPAAETTAAAEEPVVKKKKSKSREKASKKGGNFEQMERHKEDGYYSKMDTLKDADYEQMKKHGDDGYYTAIPATPKFYPKPPAPPVVVIPIPEPVVVAPPRQIDPSDPGRKFDDDTGNTGSITFTRHVKTAKEMLSGGHHDLAKKHFKEALHILPDQVAVYPGYIESCQLGSDWSEASRAIEKLIQLDGSKSKEYGWQLGEAYFNLQKIDKAVPALKKALANGHHQEQIHGYLLRIAQQQRNNADVMVEYAAICKLKPNDYKVHLDYAALLEATGKPQDAIGQYRAATTANPADGATLGRLAYLVMYHNKDYSGAINYYTKAAAADPQNAKAYQDGAKYCIQQKDIASGGGAKKKK